MDFLLANANRKFDPISSLMSSTISGLGCRVGCRMLNLFSLWNLTSRAGRGVGDLRQPKMDK